MVVVGRRVSSPVTSFWKPATANRYHIHRPIDRVGWRHVCACSGWAANAWRKRKAKSGRRASDVDTAASKALMESAGSGGGGGW